MVGSTSRRSSISKGKGTERGEGASSDLLQKKEKKSPVSGERHMSVSLPRMEKNRPAGSRRGPLKEKEKVLERKKRAQAEKNPQRVGRKSRTSSGCTIGLRKKRRECLWKKGEGRSAGKIKKSNTQGKGKKGKVLET